MAQGAREHSAPPSGRAPPWTPRALICAGTAENLSRPATGWSDAILALELETGELAWSFQGTADGASGIARTQPVSARRRDSGTGARRQRGRTLVHRVETGSSPTHPAGDHTGWDAGSRLNRPGQVSPGPSSVGEPNRADREGTSVQERADHYTETAQALEACGECVGAKRAMLAAD